MKTILILAFSLFSFTLAGQPSASVLKQGDIAPDFNGIDQAGELVNLRKSLETGPVVLVFFRGSWCPYCNKHLS